MPICHIVFIHPQLITLTTKEEQSIPSKAEFSLKTKITPERKCTASLFWLTSRGNVCCRVHPIRYREIGPVDST